MLRSSVFLYTPINSPPMWLVCHLWLLLSPLTGATWTMKWFLITYHFMVSATDGLVVVLWWVCAVDHQAAASAAAGRSSPEVSGAPATSAATNTMSVVLTSSPPASQVWHCQDLRSAHCWTVTVWTVWGLLSVSSWQEANWAGGRHRALYTEVYWFGLKNISFAKQIGIGIFGYLEFK